MRRVQIIIKRRSERPFKKRISKKISCEKLAKAKSVQLKKWKSEKPPDKKEEKVKRIFS